MVGRIQTAEKIQNWTAKFMTEDYITRRDIPSRYYTSLFFGLMVQFGPSVSAVWSKFVAVQFLFIRPSGFGLMDPTLF